jgi:hypothetical protein
VVGREVPSLLREVLDRDVLELRRLLDVELADRVEVAGKVWRGGRVLLDQSEPALGLGEDEEPEEEHALLDRVDHSNGERLLQHDAAGNDDEQAVLPHGRVVRRELLIRADEPGEALVILEGLEPDALRRVLLDRDPSLVDRGQRGHVDVEHRLGGMWLGAS